MLLETHLANKTANVTDDFKAQLLQLDKALQNVSPVAGRVSNPEQAIRFIENYLRNPQLTLAGIAQELGALINTADMQKIISAIGLNNIDAPVTASLIQLFAYIQKHQGTATLEKLLKLITDQNNLGEFKALLNQSLAHISQQQLLPMLRDADSALLLLFGLPLRHNNETHWINFRFEQEQSSTQQTATGWQVTLNFDIAALGPLQVKLHMKGQQLATTFYASQASTLEKIRHHLPQLQQILQRSGIEVLKLDVIPGQITPTQPVTAAHILDEQA